MSGEVVQDFEKWEKGLLSVLWKVRRYPVQASWLPTSFMVTGISYHCPLKEKVTWWGSGHTLPKYGAVEH